MEGKDPKYSNVLPGYLENLYSSPKPFYHADLKSGLEQTIISNENDKGEGFLERVFSDKTKTSKATVKGLLEEISLREKLDSHLCYRIDQDISRHQIRLENLNNLRLYSFELQKDRDNTNN